LIARAHAEHLVTVNWDVDPRDWADPGVSAIVSNVIDDARNGSIVVMHDGGGDRSETIAALPSILSHFRNRGYTFVTVADLLGHHFIYRTPPAA
jgi:peptidoglycan/xylan/chitin deacetylase (PgdA/CDA1 family)